MKKEEFLQILRRALNGDVPPSVVEDTVRYYDDYITQESRKGTLEEDVIAEIGDPRLIAKTIEDTTDGAGEGSYQESFMEDAKRTTVEEDGRAAKTAADYGSYRVWNLNKWYWKLLGILMVIGIICLVFLVIGGIFALLSPFLIFLGIFWIIRWLIQFFRQR